MQGIYINAFWVGVITTLLSEVGLMITYIIYNANKKDRR